MPNLAYWMWHSGIQSIFWRLERNIMTWVLLGKVRYEVFPGVVFRPSDNGTAQPNDVP